MNYWSCLTWFSRVNRMVLVVWDPLFKYIEEVFTLFCFRKGHGREQRVGAIGKLTLTQPKEELDNGSR
jgi:hypothetical protein